MTRSIPESEKYIIPSSKNISVIMSYLLWTLTEFPVLILLVLLLQN